MWVFHAFASYFEAFILSKSNPADRSRFARLIETTLDEIDTNLHDSKILFGPVIELEFKNL